MVPSEEADIIYSPPIFIKAHTELSWAFSFLEIKIKLSSSIFQWLILPLPSPVRNIFLFNLQNPYIQFKLGISIVLTNLYRLTFVIDIIASLPIINKSFIVKLKRPRPPQLFILFIDFLLLLSLKSQKQAL